MALWLVRRSVRRLAILGCSRQRPGAVLALLYLRGGPASPGAGDAALRLLGSPQAPPIEAVLTSLLNELADLDADVVFVLDDYHLIASRAIHKALTFLIEHLPPHFHLVIATRADPPLPLARARGELNELRADDLRFTPEEVRRHAADAREEAEEVDEELAVWRHG